MDKKHKEKSRGIPRGKRTNGELVELSAFDAIHELAKYDARNTDTEEGLTLFLKSWWSKEYNKPFKDPILESYTLYELLYEYHSKIERVVAAEESFELKADKIEDDLEQETIAWVEEEERRDLEKAIETMAKQKAKDEAWMHEQIKKEHGDDFGEDINTDFEE